MLLVEVAPDGLHQIIAPSSQFIVGLGDPSTSDLSAGAQGDPAGLHGAFNEDANDPQIYIPYLQDGRLTFTSLDGQVSKTFQFSDSGLRVEYHTTHPVTVQVPLALDPWERFTPGWGARYREVASSTGWGWELVNGPRLEVLASAELSAYPFTASRPDLGRAEDPNQAYPRGHYLPFPLALVEIHGEGDFSIDVLVEVNGGE